MEVSEEARFDDSDVAPNGICYTGVDRTLDVSGELFHVRSYDDEPGTAIIMEPDAALESAHARSLVDFLAGEFGFETFHFLSRASGRFEEIDRMSMQFK